MPGRRSQLAVTPGQAALIAGIALFLLLFLIVPVATVIYVAFTEKGTGAFTLVNFADFARTDLFVRSFWNSVYVSGMSVALASLFALPLADLTTRFAFRGALLIQTLGFLPLIMPPFVGAVAMQLLFGRNGTVNLLLDEWFGFKIPFMEGLNGVIFVAGRPLFPVHPDQPLGGACATSTAPWKRRRRISAARASACSAASCSRSPCPATSPARRWFS